MLDCVYKKTCSHWIHLSGPYKRNILQRKLCERTIQKHWSECFNVLPKNSGHIMKNLKTWPIKRKKITTVYKNKSVSKNYKIQWTTNKCRQWINIWKYQDLETYKLLLNWLNLALNEPKEGDTSWNKTTNNQLWNSLLANPHYLNLLNHS